MAKIKEELVLRKRRRAGKNGIKHTTSVFLMSESGVFLTLLLLTVIGTNHYHFGENRSMSTGFVADAFSLPPASSLSSLPPRENKPKRTTTTCDFSTSTTEDNPPSVEVWDGVFSQEVCRHLHELAIDHSERTTSEDGDYDDDEEDDSLDGSSIFVHRRNACESATADQLTPLEQALDSFLMAYYESHSEIAPRHDIIVEYWCRQEHLNLEAHADVDEVFFERFCNQKKRDNIEHGFRYPTVGHVLYLTKPTLGRGPTCVFPPERQGGEITDEISSVVTVPAVPGRVLRFPGNALHAVPKPADVWLAYEEDEDDHDDEEGEEDEWDYEDDDDDDDDDDDEEERSVVLFNTWEATDDEGISLGPTGVHPDPMFAVESDAELVDMMMSSADIEDSGVEVDEAFVRGMVEYARQQKTELLESWRDSFGEGSEDEAGDRNNAPVVYSGVHCRPRASWNRAGIGDGASKTGGKDASHPPACSMRVPLMGDRLRRRYPKKAVRWTVPPSFKEGVNDAERPFRFPVATRR